MNKEVTYVLLVENQTLIWQTLSESLASASGLELVTELTDTSLVTLIGNVIQLEMILLGIGNPGQIELQAIRALRRVLPARKIIALTTEELVGQDQMAEEMVADLVFMKSDSRKALVEAFYQLQ